MSWLFAKDLEEDGVEKHWRRNTFSKKKWNDESD